MRAKTHIVLRMNLLLDEVSANEGNILCERVSLAALDALDEVRGFPGTNLQNVPFDDGN